MEHVGRRTLLAAGGATIACSMGALAALLAVHAPGTDAGGGAAAQPQAVLPVAVALLCINRVALSCTLQPLAATGMRSAALGAPGLADACCPSHSAERGAPPAPHS